MASIVGVDAVIVAPVQSHSDYYYDLIKWDRRFVEIYGQTGLQHLKNVSGCKAGIYKNAKTLWHYIFARIGPFLGQLSQRGGCGDSGRP
jgi:hypothetical protein